MKNAKTWIIVLVSRIQSVEMIMVALVHFMLLSITTHATLNVSTLDASMTNGTVDICISST